MKCQRANTGISYGIIRVQHKWICSKLIKMTAPAAHKAISFNDVRKEQAAPAPHCKWNTPAKSNQTTLLPVHILELICSFARLLTAHATHNFDDDFEWEKLKFGKNHHSMAKRIQPAEFN